MKYVKSIRQISFVEKKSFYFDSKGTVTSNSVLLHDIDDDGSIEFVVGNIYGSLQVFKYLNPKPVYKCEGLGSISCISAAKVGKNQKTVLCVLTSEGECHFFDFSAICQKLETIAEDVSASSQSLIEDDEQTEGSVAGVTEDGGNDAISDMSFDHFDQQLVEEIMHRSTSFETNEYGEPIGDHQHGGPTSTSSSKLDESFDGSEASETTVSGKPTMSRSSSNSSLAAMTKIRRRSSGSNLKSKLAKGSRLHIPTNRQHMACRTVIPYFTARVPCNITSVLFLNIGQPSDQLEPQSTQQIIFGSSDRHIYLYEYEELKSIPQLVLQNKWAFSKQIYSLSPHKDADGKDTLLVGLVAGGYAYITTNTTPQQKSTKENSISGGAIKRPIVQSKFSVNDKYCVRVVTMNKNQQNVQQEYEDIIGMPVLVQGNVKFKTSNANLATFAGLDGKIRVGDPFETQHNKDLLYLDLQQEILSLNHCDFVGNGATNICVTTWDGVTYIIDQERNIAYYNMKERACAFCAGNYSISPTKTALCLVYVTFSDQIIMHQVPPLEAIPGYTLVNSMLYEHQKLPSQVLTSSVQTIHSLLGATGATAGDTKLTTLEAQFSNLAKQGVLESILYDLDATDEELDRVIEQIGR